MEAGQLLAIEIEKLKLVDAILLAIPRGGVPVAAEIAKKLHYPLNLIYSKKISYPSQPEFAIGSVCEDSIFINKNISVPKEYLEQKVKEIKNEIQNKKAKFNPFVNKTNLKNRNIILVDDGIATGNTLVTCIETLRKEKPAQIIIAVPVAPKRGLEKIKLKTDKFICLKLEEEFSGIGAFYIDFSQVGDDEVKQSLLEVNNASKEQSTM